MDYAFLFGRVGVWIGYITEDHGIADGTVLEAGARVDVRRVDELPGHRPSAEGFCFPTLNEGGIWRADLLTEIVPPTGKPCNHDHPYHYGDDLISAKRRFVPEMGPDPVAWTLERLSRLDEVLREAGADELRKGLDLAEVARAMPAMQAALLECLSRVPALSR